MAAEIRRLIGDFEEILVRESLGDIHDRGKLTLLFGQLAAMTAHIYRQGQIPKDEAVQLMTSSFTKLYESVLERIRANMKLRAQKAGIECITIGARGSKTAKMLAKTGIPWGTGEASSGLVVVFVHPDIGIAGSHKNALIPADFSRFYGLSLDDSQLTEEMSSVPFPDRTVTPDGLVDITHETVQEALDEFLSISPDGLMPKSGSRVLLSGLDFLRKDQFPLIFDAVRNVVLTNPAVTYDTDVTTGHALGQCCGIIYGGKTHPRLSEPSFYSLGRPINTSEV